MCSDGWLDVAFYAGIVQFPTALILNVIVLRLLSSTPRKTFGNYKYLMMTFSVTLMIISLCNLLSRPNVYITRSSYYIFSALKLGTSKFVGTILIAVYCSGYGLTLAMLKIQFFYRYTSVTSPLRLTIFSTEYLPAWCVFVLAYASICGSACYFLHGPDAMKDREVAEDMLQLYCLTPNEYAYIGSQYFTINPKNQAMVWNMPSIIGSAAVLLVVMITFVLVLIFGVRIYITLTKDGLACFASKELQKQFFQTLVVQTLVPFLFLYTPILTIFVLPFTGLNVGRMANWATTTMVLYPCLQPLVAIFFMKVFRNKVYDFITCYKNEQRVCALPLSLTEN